MKDREDRKEEKQRARYRAFYRAIRTAAGSDDPGEQEALIKAYVAKATEAGDIADEAGFYKFADTVRRAPSAKTPELPEGKYSVILADPPWQYREQRIGFKQSSAASYHYATKPTHEIAALAVAELAAPNCVLFLWATFPLLPDGLEVLQAWGFEYKTAFVWNKERQTYAHYHRAEAELLLLGIRGSMRPDQKNLPSQILLGKASAHSRKPDETYDLIRELYPKGKAVELFARRKRKGWQSWGKEAPK